MVVKLNLIVLQSEDIFALMSFYLALGLEFVAEQHDSGPNHYSCNIQGVVFELYPSQLSNSNLRLGFEVPSLDDRFLALLKRSGGETVKPPAETPEGRKAVVKDPDGRKIELTEAVNG